MTNMSEETCILVVGGDQVHVSTALDALRQAGWNAVGTWDPWEAVLLLSRRSFSLIAMDQGMPGLDTLGFTALLGEDPALKEVPKVPFTKALPPNELLDAVRNLLELHFPPEQPSRRDTRFVRRRRPSAVSA